MKGSEEQYVLLHFVLNFFLHLYSFKILKTKNHGCNCRAIRLQIFLSNLSVTFLMPKYILSFLCALMLQITRLRKELEEAKNIAASEPTKKNFLQKLFRFILDLILIASMIASLIILLFISIAIYYHSRPKDSGHAIVEKKPQFCGVDNPPKRVVQVNFTIATSMYLVYCLYIIFR